MAGIFSPWRYLISCNQVTLGLLFDKLNKSCPSDFSLEAAPPHQPLNCFGGSFLHPLSFAVSCKTVDIQGFSEASLPESTRISGDTQLQPPAVLGEHEC